MASSGGSRNGRGRGGRIVRAVRGGARLLVRVVLWAVVLALVWVALYKVIDPPGGIYMAREWWRLGHIERDWRDLDEISPHLARAVVAAEDARFCQHWGIDFEAVGKALEERERGRIRGASTITQQTAKNVFLWQDQTWIRKGLEVPFALAIEAIWGKRRILEVYLNVAEFGKGIFGAQAAARRYFGVDADKLSAGQAARLAAILPNPKERNPNRLGGSLAARVRQIDRGAGTIAATGDDACFLGS